jgi:hypothetical protein
VTHVTRVASFDDLVGLCEQRGRHAEAERLGGFQVDHQLEPRGLHDGQIGGIRALEDSTRQDAGLASVRLGP